MKKSKKDQMSNMERASKVIDAIVNTFQYITDVDCMFFNCKNFLLENDPMKWRWEITYYPTRHAVARDNVIDRIEKLIEKYEEVGDINSECRLMVLRPLLTTCKDAQLNNIKKV